MRLNYKCIVTFIALGLALPNLSRAAGVGSSPVTTNLVLWLEANEGLASDGSSWADQSGLGNNATALPGQNPTVVPGGFNGQTAVEFNGQAMSFAAPVVTTQQFTIVALVTDSARLSPTGMNLIQLPPYSSGRPMLRPLKYALRMQLGEPTKVTTAWGRSPKPASALCSLG
jgi:hypothetical protein